MTKLVVYKVTKHILIYLYNLFINALLSIANKSYLPPAERLTTQILIAGTLKRTYCNIYLIGDKKQEIQSTMYFIHIGIIISSAY